MSSQLWWRGPLWLQFDDIINYNLEILELDENQFSEGGRSSVATVIIQKGVDPKFSTLGKLVRVVAMCLRVARICRKERVLGPKVG